jgi:hypothetical protein
LQTFFSRFPAAEFRAAASFNSSTIQGFASLAARQASLSGLSAKDGAGLLNDAISVEKSNSYA